MKITDMWAQIINTFIGIWLMASPDVLKYGAVGRDNCHIMGPIIATFAMVACWEATRSVRKFNIPLGLWLFMAPWILGYKEVLPIINDMSFGIIILSLALVKGKITGSYGGGWRALWKPRSMLDEKT